MFAETERLRQQLETERAQHAFSRERALEAGNAEESFTRWKSAAYRKGRVEGLQLALELIAKVAREEAQKGGKK